MHTARRLEIAAVLLATAASTVARADVSHHQGGSPGQLSLVGVDRLALTEQEHTTDLQLFGSFLHASEKLDGNAQRVALEGGGSIRNVGFNIYGEYRFARGWAASLLTGVQRLDVDMPGAPDTIYSVSDTQISGRYTRDVSPAVSVTAAVSVKLPGTYPESEATGVKQIDLETKLLAAVHRLGSDHVSLVVGLGYKLRLSTIQDEITPTLLIPVRAGRFTTAAGIMGGIAIGNGSLKKDTLALGATLGFRISPVTELTAAYYQTIYGHNVVAAHIATLGVAAKL